MQHHVHAAESLRRPRAHVARPSARDGRAAPPSSLVADREHRTQRGLRDPGCRSRCGARMSALSSSARCLALEDHLALHDACRRRGRRRSNDGAVMVLPEPDSPTSPSAPRIAKLTPSTAFTSPQRVLRSHVKVLGLEDVVAHTCLRQQVRASRAASRRGLKPAVIAAPGVAESHQALAMWLDSIGDHLAPPSGTLGRRRRGS